METDEEDSWCPLHRKDWVAKHCEKTTCLGCAKVIWPKCDGISSIGHCDICEGYYHEDCMVKIKIFSIICRDLVKWSCPTCAKFRKEEPCRPVCDSEMLEYLLKKYDLCEEDIRDKVYVQRMKNVKKKAKAELKEKEGK